MMRECRECGTIFVPAHPSTRLCSQACRTKQKAKLKRKWREENSEKLRAYNRNWREEHPDYGREWQRQWRRENPEIARAVSHAKWVKWRLAHPGPRPDQRAAERRREWLQENRERLNEKRRARYARKLPEP
jgi:hypothetical protein